MNTQIQQLIEARPQILGEIPSLNGMERGRLSEQYFKGTEAGKVVLWGAIVCSSAARGPSLH